MKPLDKEQLIGVVGAGAMGGGIAEVAAMAGHRVMLLDSRAGAAARAREGIGDRLARLVEKGRLAANGREAALERIEVADGIEALAPCALVIEAIVEDLGVKLELLAALETVVGPEALLATNTSSLSVTELGAGLRDPRRFLGMHFFNPPSRMALVEIVRGLATGDEALERVAATAAAWGKRPVTLCSSPGFIVNRVARPFYGEALRLLEEGAGHAATIDALMRESGGFRMGPFELMDLIGNDVNLAVSRSVHQAFHGDARFTPSLRQQELVDAGRLGRKSGKGFYDYADGATPTAPATMSPCPAPRSLVVRGELGVAAPLLEAALAAGIAIERREAVLPGAGWLEIGEAQAALTDGRSATERAAQGLENLVLFDLALDFRQATRIAVAVADQADPDSIETVAGFFQALGKQVSRIDDAPGMIVMRTVCMLTNLGADAVHKGVCTAAAVDLAMREGTAYPRGPLEWGEAIGIGTVIQVLEHLERAYGEGRYRVAPLLRRLHWAGRGFGSIGEAGS